MDLRLFDYALPPELIAQYPAEERDGSRLLVLDRESGHLDDRRFCDLPKLLRPGDSLVLNQSRVVPARLMGRLEPGGREIELLFLREVEGRRWETLMRPAKPCRVGAVLRLADGEGSARVDGVGASGLRIVEVEWPGPVKALLNRYGVPPLPPYIRRHQKPGAEDWERYQTVYAREDGSVAAPTAGLHFTAELLDRLRAGGVEVVFLTLHVGPATFRPLRGQEVEGHRLEGELVRISSEAAATISRATAEKRRVIAVGTTTTRALEGTSREGETQPFEGLTDLFIYPGHQFKVVDGLLTNFHLPRSSLLVLVSAFAGRERILAAYRHAISQRYRFYSYGDAMLII